MQQEEEIPLFQTLEQEPPKITWKEWLAVNWSLISFGCLLVFICTAFIAFSTKSARNMLLLISLDGCRPEYLKRGLTPTLTALGEKGVMGDMLPAFPSVTFTNHYTLVTGLYPESHGILGNEFKDTERNESFIYFNPNSSRKSQWWGGEPIWVTAVKQGFKAATLFWPGSEAVIKSTRPTYWEPYNSSVTLPEKIEHILKWIDLPRAQRPLFMALYIPNIDQIGHKYGPDSPELNATLQYVDFALGQLMKGLQKRALKEKMNTIIVSDHKSIPLYKWVDPSFDLFENGPVWYLYPPPQQGKLNSPSYILVESLKSSH